MSACTYILLAGLPGTGKSTLATALAARFPGSVVLNKDTVRAALFPGDATDYSEAQDTLCVEAMLAAAAYLCSRPGPPVYFFLDGRTFSRAVHIDQVTRAAEASRAAWSILYLWCPDEIAVQRLATGSAAHPAKNRDAALYFSLKQRFQPIRRPHLFVDTSRPVEACLDACAAYLESRHS